MRPRPAPGRTWAEPIIWRDARPPGATTGCGREHGRPALRSGRAGPGSGRPGVARAGTVSPERAVSPGSGPCRPSRCRGAWAGAVSPLVGAELPEPEWRCANRKGAARSGVALRGRTYYQEALLGRLFQGASEVSLIKRSPYKSPHSRQGCRQRHCPVSAVVGPALGCSGAAPAELRAPTHTGPHTGGLRPVGCGGSGPHRRGAFHREGRWQAPNRADGGVTRRPSGRRTDRVTGRPGGWTRPGERASRRASGGVDGR